MARFTPTDIVSQYSAISALNANFDTVATLIELCLFRDGTSPNQMLTNLNMNNFKIENLADGTANSDAVNFGQVADMIADGAGSTINLSGDLTVAGTTLLNGSVGVGGPSVFSNTVFIGGDATLNNTIVAGTLDVVSLTAAGNLVVEGNSTLGDSSTDSTTVRGTLTVADALASNGLVIDQTGSGTVTYKANTHLFAEANGDTLATISDVVGGVNIPLGYGYSVDGLQIIRERGAALPADATDLASAITLVNAIKDILRNHHGLVS